MEIASSSLPRGPSRPGWLSIASKSTLPPPPAPPLRSPFAPRPRALAASIAWDAHASREGPVPGLGWRPGGLLRSSTPAAPAVGVGAAESAGAVPASGAPLLADRPWQSRLQWSPPSAWRPQLAREARPGACPLVLRAHPPSRHSQVTGPVAGGQQREVRDSAVWSRREEEAHRAPRRRQQTRRAPRLG